MLQGDAPVQEQERNLSSISLPPDIECLIVEQFDVNEAKLRKLALVYHVWTSYAQLLLFREIVVVLVRDAKDLHIFWQQLESVLLTDRFRSLESVVVNIQELVYKDDLPTAYPKVLERYLVTIHARGLLRITYSSSPAYTPPTRRDRLSNACKEIVHKFKHRVRWH
ncbi:hypothetical protein C8R43DRAFT_1193210 [Mycena crocata]|nr:hypothetical protein C8R43DRAFT_1193210 [Mycena crocata]